MTSASNTRGLLSFASACARRGRCLTLALAFSGLASSASAQDVDAETRTAAREMATQGAEAFEKHDYQTALDRFQRASSLFRAPSISVMEARTLVKLGRVLAALDKYEETRRITLPTDAPEAFLRAVSDAAREGDELRARTPLLRICILGKPPTAEVQVTLDGKPVPNALLDVERPMDPGRHQVEATSAGRSPISRSIDLSEGEHRFLGIEFDSVAPGERLLLGAAAQQGNQKDAKPSPANPLATWGWAATGLGVVGLGTSAVSGVIALGKKSELDAACHPGCPQSSADALDSFRLNRTLSYTGLVVGVAALGVGGYILLAGSPKSEHVSASVTPQGAALSGVF